MAVKAEWPGGKDSRIGTESCGIKSYAYTHILFKDVPLVEFMYLAFTPTPGEIYHR